MPFSSTIKPNLYKDSVALMRVSQQILALPGVTRASLVMGTAANKQILARNGLLSAELEKAQPSDLMIAVEGDTADAIDAALQQVAKLLAGSAPSAATGAASESPPRSIGVAVSRADAATLAQISVPGPYAAAEALKALRSGLHVFLFSDNVPIEQERAVKQIAAKKGLLVMGPDCGTAILRGVPLGFANAVRRGRVGLVGASGTGLQEVTCQIHALGEGVSNAIGTGGRDLHAEVGGITMQQGLALLARDADTQVVVIVSKPPAKAVAARVLEVARKLGKPVVVLFLGADAEAVEQSGNIFPVTTLEDAAHASVGLLRSGQPSAGAASTAPREALPDTGFADGQRYLRGLYSGGTFCTEAQLIWRAAGIKAWSNVPVDKALQLGELAPSREHSAVDLGADEFTLGRPHPMIDPAMRVKRILAEARDPAAAVILLDVVLGYGVHADPAGALVPAIREAQALAAKAGRRLAFVGFVCGTDQDPQGFTEQRAQLRDAGVSLARSSSAAALLAAALVERRPVKA